MDTDPNDPIIYEYKIGLVDKYSGLYYQKPMVDNDGRVDYVNLCAFDSTLFHGQKGFSLEANSVWEHFVSIKRDFSDTSDPNYMLYARSSMFDGCNRYNGSSVNDIVYTGDEATTGNAPVTNIYADKMQYISHAERIMLKTAIIQGGTDSKGLI